jgi:hypothetical protein
MKKIILGISLILINFSIFSQTWKETGITVIKSGSSLTVKWSNGAGGITTRKAICDRGTDNHVVGLIYRCKCTDGSGDYFTLFEYPGGLSCHLEYYDELGTLYWKNSVP